jgi:hypothetical protein
LLHIFLWESFLHFHRAFLLVEASHFPSTGRSRKLCRYIYIPAIHKQPGSVFWCDAHFLGNGIGVTLFSA